ncbi:MAG TPA: FtsQ-type POTRA domain-containing protein [Rhizomicrobium sp.]|nr:FtsQ-type POTRA domain-containing protein [Rhizomicrobium sp.]
MRSVKVERPQSRSRGKTPPRPKRGTRGTQLRSTFSKREPKPGLGDRMREAVKGWLKARRPMFMLTAGLLAITLLAAILVSGVIGRTVHRVDNAISLVVAQAGFGIAEVHLAGNTRTPPETILAALGFEPGQSIFDADVQTARKKLMKLDWVAEADVQRRYPDAIYVRVVEKLPFALWKSPEGVTVIERNGGLITRTDVSKFANLPLLDGDGAPQPAAEIVDAVAQHRAVAARVKIYQRQSQRRWNLILDDGVIVKLPETGWQKELDTLESLIVDKSILERNLAEIDLRTPGYYFFVLKSGQTSKVDRGREL